MREIFGLLFFVIILLCGFKFVYNIVTLTYQYPRCTQTEIFTKFRNPNYKCTYDILIKQN